MFIQVLHELKTKYRIFICERNDGSLERIHICITHLKNNANDYSWNNRNGTFTWTVTYSNGVATFAWSWNIQTPLNNMPTNFTISLRLKSNSTTSWERTVFAKWWSNYEYQRFGMYNWDGDLYVRQATWDSTWTWNTVANIWTSWHNVVYTKDGSRNIKVYLDGNLTNSFAYSRWGDYSSSYLTLWWWTSSQSNYIGDISEFIVENVVWDSGDVSDYYNQTKLYYGIS